MKSSVATWLAVSVVSGFCVCSPASQAATISAVDLGSPSQGSWILSNGAVALVNASNNRLIPEAGGISVDMIRTPDERRYTDIHVNGMSLQSVTVNDGTGLIQSAQFAGSVKIVMLQDGYLSDTGGSMTLSNLRLDFGTHTVYASVAGENGIGTRDNVSLWHFAAGDPVAFPVSTPGTPTDRMTAASVPISVSSGRLDMPSLSVSQLSLTDEGFGVWSDSLGYTDSGRDYLTAVKDDLGTISTAAVPEADSVSMALAGVLSVLSMLAIQQKTRRKVWQRAR